MCDDVYVYFVLLEREQYQLNYEINDTTLCKYFSLLLNLLIY